MNEPQRPNPDDILRGLRAEREGGWNDSVLEPGERKYLRELLAAIHGGARAIVIVEMNGKLKYLFSNATRLESIEILGRVTSASAEKERGERE